MKKYNPDSLRALELRAIILNALDALERCDDPAPAAVDLIDIAMLLGQALDLLAAKSAHPSVCKIELEVDYDTSRI